MLAALISAVCFQWLHRCAVWMRPSKQPPEPTAITPDEPALSAEESARMERILDRCEAQRRCLMISGLDPWAIDQWVTFVEDHNMVLVVGLPDQAVAMKTPQPERVH